MEYTKEVIEDVVSSLGEVFFVLDSGEEYIVHGNEDYSFKSRGRKTFIRTEGLRGDEWIVGEFPLDAIEHHYTHREN